MKTSIHCIIIDDEPLAVELIQDYARKTGSLNILYAGSDVYKVIQLLNTEVVDLIFIDIQMPELTGIELMSMFNQHHNFIITSAYPQYALEAFQFRVIDFLLKPITFNRFYQSVEKFIHWQSHFPRPDIVDHLFVKADKKHYKIAFDKILYIEGLKDYIRIHTSEENIIVLENMKDILDKLPKEKFMRVHRSYILSTDKIKLIEGNSIQLQNGISIPVGETFRKLVAEWVEKGQGKINY
ncbi:LytR/AlgR family response regulator transcription factor [Gynurincola endophyticus]|uniref:LytR/AlgR family response regulator transcription factor n=1 Tax=Gynurincola endophyticus TaxID=2479004 RepID=UPI000F8C6F39|nr:LytTR family DNA-binding domain-containing protein [Gynurincola endophyticus]